MSTDVLTTGTGTYYILNEGTFAGRNLREDRSLLPKGVYCPTDVAEAQLVSSLYAMAATHSDLFNLPQFKLIALPNGRFKILARGASTGELNKLLYAFLIDEERAEEWILTKRNNDGGRAQFR